VALLCAFVVSGTPHIEPGGAGLLARFARPKDLDALVFLALVWAAQTYLLLSFIREHAVNAPHYDEWEMIPVLAGYQPLTLEWLWSQHNEHRIFLPRLVYLAVLKIGHWDFRAGAFFDGALLSALAFAACAVVRRARGRAHYADAFFPLAMLHSGQMENLLGSFQIAFVLALVPCVTALLTIVAADSNDARSALLLSVAAVATALMGGHGIALVPALGLCALLAAWQLRASGRDPRVYLPLAVFCCGSFVLLALNFVKFSRPATLPGSRSFLLTFRLAMQFLAQGFGSGHKVFWPLGGYLVGFVALPCLVMLCVCVLRRPAQRLRALSLLLFLGGMAVLALGIAWARAALYADGLYASRYVTISFPFLCAVYLSWELVRPSRWADFMQVFLACVLAVMVVRNRDDGHAEALSLNVVRRAFRTDVDNGMSISLLAARHCGAVYYVCGGTVFADRIRMLREHGVSGFAQLPD
jgi:hypothetical protein